MGGKKKLTLKQMERTQAKQDSKDKAKKGEAGPSRSEKKAPGISPPDIEDKGVIKELQKMKALTPYVVASRFGLRLSAAKDFLEELNRRGIITYVSGGRNVKIYKIS